MALKYVVLAFALLALALACHGSFVPDTSGLYERKGEIKYSVEYYQQWIPTGGKEKALEEAKATELFSSPETYTIKGMNGHDFVCFLPQESASEDQQTTDTTIAAAPLLSQLNSVCIYRLEGWWTYELCPGKQIRQYHKNADGKIEAEFSLGSFVDEEGSEEAEFYTSRYDSGTACDVRQLHRQTLVRYRCGESDVTLISDLKEPSTCSYVIDVETPLLCKHPKYRKKTKTTHAIRCLQVVEVDASISPTSYSHSIRHIPSPLRDTEFVFKEQHNIKTPTFTEVPGKSQGSPQQHHDLRQQQFKPNTPGQNLQQQQQQQKNPSASQPQEDGIKISKMKVVDENGHEIETAESGVKTHTSIDTDAARQRLSEHLSQFDQGTVTIEQLKQAIKKMPGFEELQDMEVEILDEAQLTEDMMERIAQGGINIVATEAEPEEDSEPFEIPDDDEEEQEKAN